MKLIIHLLGVLVLLVVGDDLFKQESPVLSQGEPRDAAVNFVYVRLSYTG